MTVGSIYCTVFDHVKKTKEGTGQKDGMRIEAFLGVLLDKNR
jgi:hypothetical protein